MNDRPNLLAVPRWKAVSSSYNMYDHDLHQVRGITRQEWRSGILPPTANGADLRRTIP